MNKVEVKASPAQQSCEGCVLKALGACSGPFGNAPVKQNGRPGPGANGQSQPVERKTLSELPISRMT